MRPNPLIVRTFLLRGASIWLGARLMATAAIAFAGMDPLRLTPMTVLTVVLAASLLGLADIHRRHERAFLANLGVSRTMLVIFLAGPAVAGEIVLLVAASALR